MTNTTTTPTRIRFAARDLGRTVELSHTCGSTGARLSDGRYDRLITLGRVSIQKEDRCIFDDRKDAELAATIARLIEPTADIWVDEMKWGWGVKVREMGHSEGRGKVRTLNAFYGLRQAGNPVRFASSLQGWAELEGAQIEIVND